MIILKTSSTILIAKMKNKLKATIALVLFLASSLTIVPNLAQAQGISVPGPTLYVGGVTSTPYTSISEISSDGYAVSLNLGLKTYVDLWPVIPLLNGSNVNCGLSSYRFC